MTKKAISPTSYLPKILVLGIHAPYQRTNTIESYYQEFMNLVKTNEIENYSSLFLKLREISPVYFFTKGKLADLKKYCDEHEIEEIIISEVLSTQQESNLSDFLNIPIYDRTRLILEIFEKSAHSASGKLQVAVAMLEHKKTRLSGKGVGMSQQSGSIGVRGGFGETAKEKETRDINNKILKLKKKLKSLEKARAIQRKTRLSNKVPQICLIGYTNAGKSTILNTLTQSNVLAQDKLFATLETTTRELFINSKKKGVISDTVGFIQQLPHKLINAFKSTLDELQYADLLLHVVDISDTNWQLHIKVVHSILDELNVDKDMLYIFNKSDKLQDFEEIDLKELEIDIQKYNPHVLINTQSKQALSPLKLFLHNWNPQK